MTQGMAFAGPDTIAPPRDARADLLKWLALVCMTVDHVNRILLAPDTGLQPGLFAVGRFAFPIFAWAVAARLAERPERWSRYLRRLAPAALVTQPVYALAFTGLDVSAGWSTLIVNTYITPVWNFFGLLALGILLSAPLARTCTRGVGENLGVAVVTGAVAFIALTDTKFASTLLVPAYRIAIRYAPDTVPVVAGVGALAINAIGGLSAAVLTVPAAILLPGLFQIARRATGIRVPKTPAWLFYVYYPGHIAILWELAASG